MYKVYRASLVALMVKNRPANAGDIKRCNVRETGWSPVLRRSPGGGRGDSFQHPCLEQGWTEEPARLTNIHTDIKPPQVMYRIFLGPLKMSSCLYRQSCPLCRQLYI